MDKISAGQANRLQKLKNHAGHVIVQKGYNIRSYKIREELGWKMLHETRKQHKVIFVYKALHGLAPPYLLDYFKYLLPLRGPV